MANREDMNELQRAICQVTDPEATRALELVLNCLKNVREDLESARRRIAQLEERVN